MAGERTPAISTSRGGSSDDDISLREHLQRQLDTQRVYFDRIIDDLKTLLDERHENQQTAMRTALTAAETAVQAALSSAEKAVAKAETASDKRFDSVNEFRAQLADQANSFMPRTESLARHDRAQEQISALVTRHEADVTQINKRLDLMQGRASGLGDGWGYLVGGIGLVGGLIAIVVGLR